MAAFSDLLHVRIPNSYEVSSAPDVPSLGLVSGHRGNPALEYRQHLFLRGPPPGSANPPRLASYRLKPPHVPFPPTSNGLSGHKDPGHGVPESTALRTQWCCHCKVVILGSGVRKSGGELACVSKVPDRPSPTPRDLAVSWAPLCPDSWRVHVCGPTGPGRSTSTHAFDVLGLETPQLQRAWAGRYEDRGLLS